MSNVLQEMGPEAVANREPLEEVKRQLGVRHDFFDCWMYGFLENKKFDVEETVQKLRRRDTMERNELANYEITDYMRETMAKGIIQLIGDDKEGRVTFYIVTRRDYPTSKRREENKRNFDMWLSYGTRLRKENKKCRITMLINQKDASMWSNTDMTFQADVALRIAKFYPGAVDRMYICKMSNTLATLAKPIFARLPAIVSDKIRIFTDSDLQKGKLLDLFDENVLPVDLGGKNDCDGPKNWTAFAQTVERHFASLKDAVGARGMSVKEWELECLQKEVTETAATAKDRHEARQLARASRRNGSIMVAPSGTAEPSGAFDAIAAQHPEYAPIDDADSAELMSCYSDDEFYAYEDDDLPLQSLADTTEDTFGEPEAVNRLGSVRFSPRQMAPTISHHHRFLLEEERRWRHALASDEAEARMALCDKRSDAYFATEEDEEDVFGSGGIRRLAACVPAPARSILTVFLQCCCILSGVYFAAATVFCTSVVCSIIVTFFFGMFVDPTFVFPIGIAMLLASFQGALVCSRGVELTRLSYYGRLLPGFRSFGTYAPLIQLLFTFALILTQFVIFVVYAIRWDTLNGLKVAFATGWLSCTILIALHHVLYWLQPGEGDWDPNGAANGKRGARRNLCAGGGRQQPSSGSMGALPIYLLFDITEDDEDVGPSERTSAVLLVLFPVVISLLFGATFLVSKILALAVAVPIATLTAAWAVHAYVDSATSRYHAVLTKFVVWFGSIVWQYDCYTFGFRDYSARWVMPVAVESAILGVFMLLALLNLKRANSTRLFRIVLLMIVSYFVACIILTFVIVDWSVGVFCLAMALHAGLCISRNSGSAVTIAGRFLASTGTALLLIACVMLGWLGTTHQYSNPRALPSGGTSGTYDVLSFVQFQDSPLCGLQLDLSHSPVAPSFARAATNPPVTPVDAILLTELCASYNTPTTFQHDLSVWLPTATYQSTTTYPRVLDNGELPVLEALLFTMAHAPGGGQTDTVNVSMLVLQAPVKFHAIRAMAAWSEAIALSPLSIFLPMNWTERIVEPYSFSSRMIPFEFRHAMDDVQAAVIELKYASAAEYGEGHELYLTGAGVAGGLAQVIGSRTKTRSLGFNAPGIAHILSKYDVTREAYYETAMTVNSHDAALTTVGGAAFQNSNQVPCGLDADTCQGMAFLSSSLLDTCEAQGRKHT